MFYLLNFENHQFITCNNASAAEAKIRSLLAAGCPKDSLEVVNASDADGRMEVDAFRILCEEQGWVDNSVVDFLVERESERQLRSGADQKQTPEIALWGRLGISLCVAPEELTVLKGGGKEARDLFVELVRSDRCDMSGETYFPADCNQAYLGDIDGELEFHLDCALHESALDRFAEDQATFLHNDKILLRLPRRDWEMVAAALDYAIEDHHYEAEKTADASASAEIRASAYAWEAVRELIGSAITERYGNKFVAFPALDDAIASAEKVVKDGDVAKDSSMIEDREI